MSTRRNLYNGNISAMATTITHPDTREVMPLGAVYRYDQLNRITEMKAYANFDFTNNVWKNENMDGSMYFNPESAKKIAETIIRTKQIKIIYLYKLNQNPMRQNFLINVFFENHVKGDFNSDANRFGFNSMEKIEETETMDFGARLLDGDLGVWLACDPLAAKYPSLSPYCFVGNMPIIAIDPDGRDFGIRVEESDKGNTITIVANIYTVARDKKAVMEGEKFWEGQNGKFAYVDNVSGKEYEICFEINIFIEKSKDQAIKKADNDPIGNSMIANDKREEFINDETVLGFVERGEFGFIRESYKSSSTMIHEFGHFFGIPEMTKGIMIGFADIRESILTKGIIQAIFMAAKIDVGNFDTGDTVSKEGRETLGKQYRNPFTRRSNVENLKGADKLKGGKIVERNQNEENE